jgi:hypothetical protein
VCGARWRSALASARQQRIQLAGAVEGVELVAAADVEVVDSDVRDRGSVAVPARMGGVTKIAKP